MRTRYEQSRLYYFDHKSELDNQASFFANSLFSTGTVFDGDALSNVSYCFGAFGLYTAQRVLSHFLDNSGNNYQIDIEEVISNGGVNNLVYKNIVDSIDGGQKYGQIRIEQGYWGSDSWSFGQDAHYAFGTLRIDWETDGTDVVMFVNDIYSFDINDYSSKRSTIPLYKNAGDLVLGDQASDFYFTGRTGRIKIGTLRHRY